MCKSIAQFMVTPTFRFPEEPVQSNFIYLLTLKLDLH